MQRWIFLITIFIVDTLFAQSLWHSNQTLGIGGGCFQLTKNKDKQKGSLWRNDLIDLTKPFRVYMRLNLGTKDAGADGIAIVFHQSPDGYSALGGHGADLGYATETSSGTTISPSLVIEFDTYNNGTWLYNDIVDDHCQINAGGIPSWTLAPAVPIAGSGVNVENNTYYLVEVRWDPATQMVDVFFECNLVQSLQVDLVNWLFAGNSWVYYGVTASTGAASNAQYFCELWHDAGPDMTFCPGTPVTLLASSNFQSVTWSPSASLSCANCLQPVATPTVPTQYVLTGVYNCLEVTDTVALIQDCTFLPVELSSFQAQCQASLVRLQWTTLTELHNERFDVERSSDGQTFVHIGSIAGGGTSMHVRSYEFVDEQPLPGTSYYRLRQVDFGGATSFSPVVGVQCASTLALWVAPNPVADPWIVYVRSNQETSAWLTVVSVAGQVIYHAPVQLMEGERQFSFSLRQLPPGLYEVRLQTPTQLRQTKAIVPPGP